MVFERGCLGRLLRVTWNYQINWEYTKDLVCCRSGTESVNDDMLTNMTEERKKEQEDITNSSPCTNSTKYPLNPP